MDSKHCKGGTGRPRERTTARAARCSPSVTRISAMGLQGGPRGAPRLPRTLVSQVKLRTRLSRQSPGPVANSRPVTSMGDVLFNTVATAYNVAPSLCHRFPMCAYVNGLCGAAISHTTGHVDCHRSADRPVARHPAN